MVASPTLMDAASVSLLVSAAASLAAEAPEAAEARWDALVGDDELDAEIAKYRAALSALSQRLRDLGGFEPSSSRGGSDDGEAAGGAAGGSGGGAGGAGGTIEGVEVRFD